MPRINSTSKILKEYTKEIKTVFAQYAKRTERHFDVVAEDIKGKIQGLSEQVAANTEKLILHDQYFDEIKKRLDIIEIKLAGYEEILNSHSAILESHTRDLAIIKEDLLFVKQELKSKADWEEFNFLEKRVLVLEKKLAKV